jgi:ComF family protein
MARCAACRRRPGLIDLGRAAGEHDGMLRNIIHAFKYDRRRSLAVPLAALMRDAALDLLADANALVPVPLHPWRRWHRGFNHASDLAVALGGRVVDVLWRTRATLPQAGLTAAARRRNVHGAFTLSPLLSRAGRAACLEDQVLVLVDDVRTTGATLESCASVLKRAGAREVRALTVAIARAPGAYTSRVQPGRGSNRAS